MALLDLAHKHAYLVHNGLRTDDHTLYRYGEPLA